MNRTKPEGGWSWLGGKIYGWFTRDPETNRALVDLAGLSPTDRVLDVGCGSGAALARAAGIVTEGTLAAVDPTSSLAAMAARRVPAATVEVAAAEKLPFHDNSFTVAWTIASLHHWPDIDAGLAEIGRVLEAGGRLLVAERLLDSDGGHGLSPAEIEDLTRAIGQAGFDEPLVEHHSLRRRRLALVSARRQGPSTI